MSLIKTPTQLTPIQQFVQSQKQNDLNMLNTMKGYLARKMATIWNNPDFPAQDIFNEYGPDAASLFQVANLMIQLITFVDPTYIPPNPPKNITITQNQDGTVTVTIPSPTL